VGSKAAKGKRKRSEDVHEDDGVGDAFFMNDSDVENEGSGDEQPLDLEETAEEKRLRLG
jgi:hypothetical protein